MHKRRNVLSVRSSLVSALLLSCALLVWQHPRELRCIHLGDDRRAPQPTLLLSGLAAQDVLLERVAAEKLSGFGPLEALGRSAVCLELGHVFLVKALPRKKHLPRSAWTMNR